MCRAKSDPKCRRCTGSASPVTGSARGKAYHSGKKAAGLTAEPKVMAPVPPPAAPVDADTRDIESLRALAASIDDAYADGNPAAIEELDAAYGSPLGAVRALGAAVTSRGEEFAGISADEAVESWQRRRAAAGQSLKDTHAAAKVQQDKDMQDFDAWSAEHHPGVKWEDTGGEGSLRYLRNTYHSEELAAAIAARDEATEFWEKSGIQNAADQESKADLRKIGDGSQAAVAEIRPLGGHLELHEFSEAPAALAVAEASSVYPADWVKASTEAGPLAAAVTTGRAGHNANWINSDRVASDVPRYVICPAGSPREDTPENTFLSVEKGKNGDQADPTSDTWLVQHWDVKRVKGKPKGYDWEAVEPGVWRRKPRGTISGPGVTVSLTDGGLPGRPKGFAVATHELGHHMQVMVPGLSRMEDDWLIDRTTLDGKREELVPRWKGANEFVRTDSFINTYIGREYADAMGDKRETTEVLTMGTQGIFGGDHGGLIGMGSIDRDDDMRAFILGAMASAGTKRRSSSE